MVVYKPAVVKIGRLASKAERIIFLFFCVRAHKRMYMCVYEGLEEKQTKTENNKQQTK